MTGDALGTITNRCSQAPIASSGTRPHPVLGLLAILLALVLRHRGKQILDEHAVRVFAELDRGRLQDAARVRDSRAELEMRFEPAREARDIVDDDDVRIGAVLLEVSEHRHHAGAAGILTGHVVAEYLYDLQFLVPGIFAAAMLLAFQAMPLRLLLRRGNPCVDHGLVAGGFDHGQHFPAIVSPAASLKVEARILFESNGSDAAWVVCRSLIPSKICSGEPPHPLSMTPSIKAQTIFMQASFFSSVMSKESE